MKRAALLLTCAMVAGCVQYEEIEGPPQGVNFTAASARDNLAKTHTSEIRTVATDPNGNGKRQIEIKGAACEIKGNGYHLRVISPAKVDLPTYLGVTDPLHVECKTDQITRDRKVSAINTTEQALRSSSSQTTLLGVLLESAIKTTAAVTRDPSKDKFRYPQVIAVDVTPAK